MTSRSQGRWASHDQIWSRRIAAKEQQTRKGIGKTTMVTTTIYKFKQNNNTAWKYNQLFNLNQSKAIIKPGATELVLFKDHIKS